MITVIKTNTNINQQIYVEIERARLTRILSKMKEDEGNIQEAAKVLQELQVSCGRLDGYWWMDDGDDGDWRWLTVIDLDDGVQVETFGQMERREKTDFLLEQVRLCLDNKDYIRAQIMSNKITRKTLNEPDLQDLKLRFYYLMIRFYANDSNYLEICKYVCFLCLPQLSHLFNYFILFNIILFNFI